MQLREYFKTFFGEKLKLSSRGWFSLGIKIRKNWEISQEKKF